MAASNQLPRPSRRTTSRCSPQTARGTHAFEIAGYSLHRGLGAGQFIRSAAFDVGGYIWCIRFYPDGYVADDEDSTDVDANVAVFLELLNEEAEVRAHYDFRLLDHATGSSSSVVTSPVPQVFDTLDDGWEEHAYAWGTDEFLERTELEASRYLLDDRLVLECDVTVVKEPLVEENTMASTPCHVVEVPPPDLSRSLGRLLEMEEQADVIFKVKDEVFHAHKLVLAVRSPILVAEPDELVMEAVKRECIEIEDMDPAVFKVLLHFVYTDTLPAMEGLDGNGKEDFVKQLLVAADKYAMDRLKLICEDILADQHHCRSNIKCACAEYVVSHSARVDGAKPSSQKRSWVDIFSYLWEKATMMAVFLCFMKYKK